LPVRLKASIKSCGLSFDGEVSWPDLLSTFIATKNYIVF
jgi:hypothetical protein